jgi:outer membrane protein assembly factor BamB
MRSREIANRSASPSSTRTMIQRVPRFRSFRLATICLAASSILPAPGALAEDWPAFRGPTGQGVSTAANSPVVWGHSAHVAWRTSIRGKGWSSPVVHGGRIYLTTADPIEEAESAKQSLRALCLDAATGDTVWDKEVFVLAPSSDNGPHAKNSYASPTPIIAANRIYVHFGPHGTAALDLEGAIVWKNRGVKFDSRHGAGGSPIISGDHLIFNCDGVERPFVVALDCATGDEQWRTYRPDIEPERFSFSTPLEIAVDGKRQVVSPGSSVVCSYSPDSGQELWRFRYPGKWSIVPRPVFSHGLVFVCTGYEGPAELLAIRPNGSGDVTDTHLAWRAKDHVPHTPSPVVSGDELYMVSDSGVATCRDAAKGKLHWRKRLGGNFSASLVFASDRVYFPSEEGECVVLAANTTYKELARNDLGEPTLASYALVDSSLFIRTEGHLYRIER